MNCLTEKEAGGRGGWRPRQWRWRQRAARRGRRGLLALLLALTVLASSQADYRPSAIDRSIAPYRYSIVAWELGHLPDKWVRELVGLWPGREELTREERGSLVREFFTLGLEQRRLEGQLRRLEGAGPEGAGMNPTGGPAPEIPPPPPAAALARAAELELIRERRRNLLPEVEATVEAELTRVLRQEDIVAGWGRVFPPVDTVFGRPPNLLALSPRDRIYRQQTVLLRPDLSDGVKGEIEDRALRSANLSAIVEGTGGLSVYPSVVLDTVGLRYALEVVAHEWVHHWLFFRPLGRNFQGSPELLTLNETAATIAGAELGDLTFSALTGPPAGGEQFAPELPEEPASAAPAGFDFTTEMRRTRRHTEELLAQGDIAGAEAYMEARRRHFVANGYYIRKLNQAYFAFHGAYATGPGSVSPIGGQLQELRRRSPSLKDFLETVAQFGSYGEFLEYLESGLFPVGRRDTYPTDRDIFGRRAFSGGTPRYSADDWRPVPRRRFVRGRRDTGGNPAVKRPLNPDQSSYVNPGPPPAFAC